MKSKAFKKALKSFEQKATFQGHRLRSAMYSTVFAEEIELMQGKQGFVRRRIFGQQSPGFVSEGSTDSGDVGVTLYPTRPMLRDLDENVNGWGHDTARRNAACAPEALKEILDQAEAEGNPAVKVGDLILKKTATDYSGKSSDLLTKHFGVKSDDGQAIVRQNPIRSLGENEAASMQGVGGRVERTMGVPTPLVEVIITDIFRSPTRGDTLAVKVTRGVFLKELPVKLFHDGIMMGETEVDRMLNTQREDITVAVLDQDFGLQLSYSFMSMLKAGDILRQF